MDSPYASAKGLTPETRRTSSNAADSIAPIRADLQRMVLRALARLGTATTLEIVSNTGQSREAVQPRVSELIALGLVEPTGARRRNPSGRSAAVVRLTSAGRLALATT